MSDPNQDDSFFERLVGELETAEPSPAPSRLKAKLLTALLRKQEESGRLRVLGETRARGYGLCIFEDLWERVTAGEAAHALNCCQLCHARVLAEHLEHAPLYWGRCPYAAFSKK